MGKTGRRCSWPIQDKLNLLFLILGSSGTIEVPIINNDCRLLGGTARRAHAYSGTLFLKRKIGIGLVHWP